MLSKIATYLMECNVSLLVAIFYLPFSLSNPTKINVRQFLFRYAQFQLFKNSVKKRKKDNDISMVEIELVIQLVSIESVRNSEQVLRGKETGGAKATP